MTKRHLQQDFRASLSAPYCWSCPDSVSDRALQQALFQKAILADLLLAVRYYGLVTLFDALEGLEKDGLLDPMIAKVNKMELEAIGEHIGEEVRLCH